MSITPRNRWKYPEWDADWQNWQDKFEDLVLGQDASVFSTIEGMKPVFKKLPQSQILENDGGVVLRILDDLVLISRTLNVALTIESGDTILMQNGFVCAVTTPGLVGPQETEFEILTDVPIDPDIQVFGYIDEDFNINWYNGSVLVKDEPSIRIFSFRGGSGEGEEYYAGTGLDLTVGNVFNHLNTIDAKSTRALYPISYDAQGHITGSNSAVTSLPNQYSLVLQADGGEVEGESKYTYYGSVAKTLNIVGGSNVSIAKASGQWTISSVNTTYSAGTGLSLSGTTFNHSNSVTSKTEALYPIAYDAQGHITASGSAVTSLKNPNNLILKIKSGTTEETDLYTYDGSAAKTLDFKQGSNITLTAGAGTLTIASTDTTYSAGTGLSLAGTTFNHSNSVTAQSTQALYPIKIDAQGHISAYGTAVTTLPNANALTLKIKSGATEGTSLYTYTGATAKTLDFKQGTNVTLTAGSGTLTIASTDTTYPLTQGHIAYGNGTGITGEADLFYNATSKRIGLRTESPEFGLDINGISGFGGSLGMSAWASGGYPTMYIRSSRSGTVGSYSATLANQTIARILVQGSSGTEHIDAIQMSVVSDVASGDWDTSDNRSAHLRISLMSSGTLTERLRIRSTGVLYGANIILADANKAGYTNEGIPLSSSGQWENIVSLAGDNCTLFGAILAASSGPAYTASLGIIKSGLDFRHSNSVTAQGTQALYPLTYDAQGHITGAGSAVTTLPNANALTLQIKSGTSEGTSRYTYTGATAKTLDFIQGTNVTLTAGSGTLTIASTNTTYSAGTGLSLAGTTFNHSNSVTAQATQALYPLTYDAQGHITGAGSAVTTLKNPNNLILKIKTGTAEGLDLYTYDGSVGKTIDIRQGSNITLTEGVGILTISSTNTTYSAGTGLSLSGTTFNHSNSVTSKTQALYPIAYDGQGHITSSGSVVTSLPNPNNLILKIKNGSIEGTDLYTYDGSVGKTIDIREGSNVTLTGGVGTLTISATNTTYTSSLGISLVGTDFRHSNSTTVRGTRALYPISIDGQGHVTGSDSAVTSLPTPSSLILRVDGLSVEGTSQYTFDGSIAKTLNIIGGSNVSISKASGQWTFSSVNTTYSAGTGLSLSGTTFNHSNSVTAQGTQALRPIAIDGQGHISAYGSAITTLPTPSSLVLRADGLSVEGTSQYTFDGSVAKTLNVVGGSNVSIAKASGQWTISSVNTTYSAGTGLSLSGTTFNHSNSVTAQGTQALYPLTYDAQGHITGAGSAVTTLPNANALTLQIKSGTSEGTSRYTYTGAAVKALNFLQGTNVTLTAGAGTLTIASTDTTYSAGTGLSLAGTTFNHSNSVTAQSTQALYPIKIDAQGHISAYGTAVTSLKNPNNLILKIKSGTTEGTDLYTYDGSTAKTLDIKQGSNVTLTEAAGSVTIAATDTTYPLTQGHIAYGNGTGITGEAALFWDSANKCIGLNTVSPEFGLDLNGTSGKNIMFGLSGWASTNHPRLYIRSSRSGTVGSYSATLANQTIARIAVQGSSGTEHIDAMQMLVVSEAASGDWDTSDNRSANLRISLMSSGVLTERLRIRSTGVLYGANIILADANKAGYTNEGIPLSSSGQWESIVSLAGDNCTLFGAILAASTAPVKNPNNLVLKIKSGTTEGTNLYTYDGSAAKTLDFKQGANVTLTAGSGTLTIASTDTTYTNGTGLSLAGTTFNHSNSVTATEQATPALYPIKIDAQGHISAYGTAVTSLPTPNSLILRADGLSVEGTSQYTFDGSVAKTLNVVGGSNVSIAKASGQWTISSTDTTYPITNREIAYGTGTGITSNSSLSWDTSNYYIRLFRASNTAQADIRFYLENATGDRRIGNNRSMGRIRFYGAHDSSTHAVGISVDAITDGDWAVNETRSTKLGLYMRHQNVESYVYTFKSNGSIYSSSLAFSDGNKSGYTNDSMPLSSSGQWENIVSLAGNNCTLFGAILAASQKALIPATSVGFGGADNSLTGNALYFKYLTSFRHLRLGNSSPIFIDEVLDSFYVEGALEIKGVSYLRNNIHMLANVDVYDKLRIRTGSVLTFGSDDRATITLSSTGTGSVDGLKIGVPNTMGNYMLICRNDQLSTDWSKTSSTDPVLYIQSGLASANYYTALSCNTNGTSSIVAGQGGIEFRHRTQTSSNIANRDMSFGSNNSSSTNNGFNYMFGYNNTIDSASSYSNIVLGNDCSANSRMTIVRGKNIIGWWDGANHFGCRKIQDTDNNGDTQAMDGLCISQFHTANNSTKYFYVLGSSTTPFVVTPGHVCWISMKVLSTTPGSSGSNYGNYALHNVELAISHTPGGTLTTHLISVERVSYSGLDIEFSSSYNSVSGNNVSLGFRRTFCSVGSTATSYHVAHVYSAKLTKGFIYSGPA